jgi:hypothetical protein
VLAGRDQCRYRQNLIKYGKIIERGYLLANKKSTVLVLRRH